MQKNHVIKKPQRVLFDMDGVIFDSEKLILKGWQQVAADAGIPDFEAVLVRCFGTNEAATKKNLCRALRRRFSLRCAQSEGSDVFFLRL